MNRLDWLRLFSSTLEVGLRITSRRDEGRVEHLNEAVTYNSQGQIKHALMTWVRIEGRMACTHGRRTRTAIQGKG